MTARNPILRRLSASGRARSGTDRDGSSSGTSSSGTPTAIAGRSRLSVLGLLLILAGLVLLAIAATGTVALRPSPETPPSQIAAIVTPPPPLQVAASPTPTATPFAERLEALPILPTPTPEPTPTPRPKMPPPTRIQIPSVGIDAPVVEVGYKIVEIQGIKVIEWEVAEYAAGHHNTSANPGEGGNIVITGHSDWKGEVFRTLEYVKLGDEVILTSDAGIFRYRVVEIHYRKEVGVPLEERIATGRFLDPMPEERVTLVTCWPYGIDDHRIIVIAKPVG